MRYMVEQGQTTGSRQKTTLSGFCLARRFTRLISVPTAHLLPEGDSLTLRGRLPGTDSVQVRLNTGGRELVAFAPVPIEVEEAPCSGPTADGICLQKMASGFRTPAHLTSPPGDDRLMAAPTLQGRSSSRLDPRSRAPSTRSGQRG